MKNFIILWPEEPVNKFDRGDVYCQYGHMHTTQLAEKNESNSPFSVHTRLFWFIENDVVVVFLIGNKRVRCMCVCVYSPSLQESFSLCRANQFPVARPSSQRCAAAPPTVVSRWVCWLWDSLSSRSRSCKESIMLTVVQPYPVSTSALRWLFFSQKK